jgi:hypothetical protein
MCKKVTKARLDADRKARPKTELRGIARRVGAEDTVSIGPGAVHVDLETGERVDLDGYAEALR